MAEDHYALVYDATLRRPGCAILQVLLGGTVPDFNRRFPSTLDDKGWLTAPTKDMKLYRVTPEELEWLTKYHGGYSLKETSHGRSESEEKAGPVGAALRASERRRAAHRYPGDRTRRRAR